MITEMERLTFVQHADEFADKLMEDQKMSAIVLKVLTRTAEFLPVSVSGYTKLSKLPEHVLSDRALTKKALVEVLRTLGESLNEMENERLYTTGELAKYFGVSITTINNWIKENRFEGFQRSSENQQARIPGDTLWRARTGKTYAVQEIVNEYEEENTINAEKFNEQDFLKREIAAFEQKYHGSLDDTLAQKSLGSLTAQEESDLSLWRYLARRLSDVI